VGQESTVIKAAGGVIFRETPAGEEVMLVYRKRYGDWTFPKGKLKEGESFQQAAVREVREETGCTVELGESLGSICYEVNSIPKVVLFWRARVLEQAPLQENEEVAEARWLPLSESWQRLSHRGERDLLRRASEAKPKPDQTPAELRFEPWK